MIKIIKFKGWLNKNTHSLIGKKIAVTGTTGGLGSELIKYLAFLGANLIFLDRNSEKSQKLAKEISLGFPDVKIQCINMDLSDFQSVKRATEELKHKDIDIFIHNAGAYSIPRCITDIGYDNVFQINFISPYYIIKELTPLLKEKGGKAVAVGSIAHNYSKAEKNDIDFRNKKRASLVYGNAKRYLMFSLFELMKKEDLPISITHPGITFTNITAHYPKIIFAIIKHPMKIIFMKPEKACLSVLKGVFSNCGDNIWIGPRIFGIWGKPKHKRLKTCFLEEKEFIYSNAEKIYSETINT